MNETITDKTWFAEDEWLDEVTAGLEGEQTLYHWKTETYITAAQVKLAVEDDDVTVGDIEKDEEQGFHIALYPNN